MACKALAVTQLPLASAIGQDLGDAQGTSPMHASQSSERGGTHTLMRPCAAGAANGHLAAAEHASALEDTGGEADMHVEDPALADGHAAALTLHGMVRRVARLAGETSWTRCATHAVLLID